MKFFPKMIRLSLVFLLLAMATGKHLLASNLAEAVIPSYTNALINGDSNPDSTLSSSVVLFSGSIGNYAAPQSGLEASIPTAADSGIFLASSAMAQPFSAGVPFPNFVKEHILAAQEILYPDTSQTREQIEGSGRAFRYRQLLFADDGEGAISSDFERIGEWYGDADRANAEKAIEELAQALKFAPEDTTLRNAILDAYYDLMVAEVQFIKITRGTLAEWTLGFRAAPSGGFIINEEIEVHKEIIEQYRFIFKVYGEFLNRRFALNVNEFDPNAAMGIPYGTFVFQQEQPLRNQNAMSFVDADGILKTVPDYDPEDGDPLPSENARELLSGYKDYALLLTLLRDYGQTAADLAQLYGLRKLKDSENDDIQTGLFLISQTQQDLYLTVSLLKGLLPGFTPQTADGTGIAETINGIEVSRSDLNNAQTFLLGETNALGFDPDFLVLIQEFPDSTEGNQFDSFDAMVRWIRNTDTSPLNFAEIAYNRAFENFEKYKGFADQVFNEMSAINTTMSQRYFEITGYDPQDEGSHREDPTPGSKLWLIESTINQLEAKSEQLTVLNMELDEGWERAQASVNVAEGLKEGIENATRTYKGTITTQHDKITSANARQAGAQAIYDTASDVAGMSKASDLLLGSGWGIGVTVVAGAINTGIQIEGETTKGHAEKELELAAAEYEAELEKNDTELVPYNIYKFG
jgi:hypothetical protein